MRYHGGGIGHVGAGSNHERDDGWMDDKGDDEDMERQPESGAVSGDDTDDEHSEVEEGSESEEEDLGPEDGEGDDEEELQTTMPTCNSVYSDGSDSIIFHLFVMRTHNSFSVQYVQCLYQHNAKCHSLPNVD